MDGRRIFDGFGFRLPKQPKQQTSIKKLESGFKEWEYLPEYCNWVEKDGASLLTNYKPPRELTSVLEKNIETSLH